MTADLLAADLLSLVPQYGLVLLGLGTFLSCLALPVPTSLMMLSAGGFVAAGDLVGWQVVGAALGGAVLGDQAGYRIGRAGGGLGRALITTDRQRNRSRARLVAKAARLLHRHGTLAVFVSRWLVSPLGPYVNFASGAAGLGWAGFTRAAIAGETIWVAIYVGLGAAFADDLLALADLMSSVSGLLVAVAVVALSGLWLRAALRGRRNSA